ncbi:P-loop containing nucleoside triphosphate hydrolase protein [Hypoxylon crocopeplum]|nr:P-loop containing nucleoside triphosphate hydrolase protein [Hypoxylon crocopeplum]
MVNHITKPKKAKSKRTPVRLRHKIEKASANKQRKARKDAKKNPQWKSKLKKDPGIPNLFPYKEKILHEIEEGRRRKQEEQQRRKELAKAAKTGSTDEAENDEATADGAEEEGFDEFSDDHDDAMDEDGVDDDSNPMAALLASAKAAAEQYDRDLQSGDEMDEDESSDNDADEDGGVELRAQSSSRKAHDKVFKQVVDQADVVLYVLDARDPEGTRSREVERMVMAAASGGKRLMLVLNKIDLIPSNVLKDWLAYLRRYFPTLPLRASGSAPNAQTFNHRELTVQSTSSTLFKSLKSFAATKQLKRAISVGVIGYPNVGKSSVINALLSRMGGRGAAACPAGAEAGVTTSIRAVKIDSKLTLLDSPGIVFPSALDGESSSKKGSAIETHAHLILLNAIPPKQIEDPVPAVTLLLKRLSASPELLQKLMNVYDLPPLMTASNGDATTDFLVQVARKRGRLGRGGVPNLSAAAMTVVTDWRDGRIQGWVDAPVLPVAAEISKGIEAYRDSAGAPTVMADQKEIVTEWAKEFKLEGLWGDDGEDAKAGDAMVQ